MEYTGLGLSDKEVNKRIEEGKVNGQGKSKSKTYKDILFTNIFNFFNILNFILAAIIVSTGQYKNMLFIFVILANTFIAIFQEIRSKITVEKLSILSQSKSKVIRNGRLVDIDPEDIVVDDIIRVEPGDQLPVDCLLIDGSLEMDESSLTGESETQVKNIGSFIYSPSVVVSGSALLQAKIVGTEAYANQMTFQVKKEKKYSSKLRDAMNFILKIVTYAIVPLGLLMYIKNAYFFKLAHNEMVLKTVAPLIGTIPEGLILLTSIALASAIYQLAKKKILVQELYCIEGLARVNTLCVDKTGTITEGRMEVVDVVGSLEEIMPSYLSAFTYENPSDKALIARFGKQEKMEIESKVDFSSQRKFSSVTFKAEGTYALGAFEFLIKKPKKEDQRIVDNYISKGHRVLVLAKSDEVITEDYLPDDLKIVGFIAISDVIRENTQELFKFFKNEGVNIKIISGDNPVAVSAIAKKAGLEDVKEIDVSQLTDAQLREKIHLCNVFGRVSPEQKALMIEELQDKGNVVAMTGDGVNDVLALKQADVSIAMAQGCDAAKQISNIVLLENNFKNLFDILMQGRRVINNIQRVSTLFLNKTVMSIIFGFVAIFSPIEFPFIPIQLTFISTLTIGIPGLFLSLEHSTQRVKDKFISQSIAKASISAAILVASICLFIVADRAYVGSSKEVISTMATYLSLVNGLYLVVMTSLPLNKYKRILIGAICGLTFLTIYFIPNFLQLATLSRENYLLLAISIAIMLVALTVAFTIYEKKDRANKAGYPVRVAEDLAS